MKNQEQINQAAEWLREAEAVMIGAGAGLSTAAGYVYTGERFDRYFADFAEKYGFHDMYSGGFYPYSTPEEFWAYWSRYIWINRYAPLPGNLYAKLLRLVRGKDYFVLTTNVDHCFQRAGFDKTRMFYTQGDYGLLQCSKPCSQQTWDNEDMMRKMVESQGYVIQEDRTLELPEGKRVAMKVDSALIPKCPNCGRPMTTNLRSDDRFVEDEGWKQANVEYEVFVTQHAHSKMLYIEIGVGYNTPGIIKYNFWQQVYQNEEARYLCLNYDDARVPKDIVNQSIGIEGDSAAVIDELCSLMEAE